MKNTTFKNYKFNNSWLILIGIILLAVSLRLWGIQFGLPYEYHVDEVQYVRQAAQMGSTGLNPVWWNNPPFFKYILLLEDAGLFILGRILGWYTSTADFGAKLSLDPTLLYLLGRGTTAIMGALTVMVTYFIGSKAYNKRVGLLASFLLAICYLPVRDSHFAVNDTPVTLLISLVLLASIQIIKTRKTIWCVIGGSALGIGFAIKYSALIAIIPLTLSILFAIAYSSRKSILIKAAITYSTGVLAALLASPYFIIDASKVWHDAYEALYLAGRNGFEGWQIDPAGGYVFYLKTLVWGMGWILLVVCLLGIAYGVFKHQPTDFILLSLPIIAYITMGAQKMYFARFLLPFIPAFIILGALFLDNVIFYFERFSPHRKVILITVIIIVCLQPLMNSIRLDYLFTQVDTRTVAKEWIEKNIPSGAKVAMDWHYHSVPLSSQDHPLASSRNQYQITYIDGKGLSDHSLDWYQTNGYQYLITSSNITNIQLVDPVKNDNRNSFYYSLDQKLELIKIFQPTAADKKLPFIFDEIYGPAISLWQREQPGPIIKIYEFK